MEIENGYHSQKRNLVDDAKFETMINEENMMKYVHAVRRQSRELADEDLQDDDVIALKAIAEAREKEEEKLRVTIMVTLKDNMLALGRVIKIVETHNGEIMHIESRESVENQRVSRLESIDVLLRIDIKHDSLIQFLKAMRRSSSLSGVKLLSSRFASPKLPWYPKHVSDLDQCNHLLTKVEPDLDMSHPGWKDLAYRERRKEIARLSFDYKHGDPIPKIEYTQNEKDTWKAVYKKVVELLPSRACANHVKCLELMRECGYAEDNIPQLEDVSNYLKKKSGFSLRPAAGLITARDFLASLAFRVFQCTQYVRHHSAPHHSVEPDCIHELLGHAPMFCDPVFAQFSQEIGLASLGASDREIEKLATVYWFTVEFGLCKENGQIRAYGAGLLSSYGELLHSLSEKPEYRAFDPASAAVQEYDDQAYQDVYFVAESMEDAMEKFRKWVREDMGKTFEMRHNPYTDNIEVIDSVTGIETVVSQMRLELNHLNNALRHMKKAGAFTPKEGGKDHQQNGFKEQKQVLQECA